MTATLIVFILAALLILASAVMVVSTRDMVHAALWLIAALFGVAIIYALLDAGFLAVVQVVVYIGAIAVMFIFAVMLTRRELRDSGPQHNKNWWVALVMSILSAGGLYVLMSSWSGFGVSAAELPADFDTLGALGIALISPDAYVLPFEVASVLLLAAMIGAVYLAMGKKK